MGFLFNRKFKTSAPIANAYRCNFNIKSSTLPPSPGYDQLNDIEQKFFSDFEHALVVAKLSPYDIVLTRLDSGAFNVNHPVGYLGKINLQNDNFYMQYFGPRGATKEVSAQTIDECIEIIPLWIQCIKRYQNVRKQALRI